MQFQECDARDDAINAIAGNIKISYRFSLRTEINLSWLHLLREKKTRNT